MNRVLLQHVVYNNNSRCINHTCPICLIDFEEKENISITQCLHCFHTECIHGYINFQRQRNVDLICPYCRQPLIQRVEVENTESNRLLRMIENSVPIVDLINWFGGLLDFRFDPDPEYLQTLLEQDEVVNTINNYKGWLEDSILGNYLLGNPPNQVKEQLFNLLNQLN